MAGDAYWKYRTVAGVGGGGGATESIWGTGGTPGRIVVGKRRVPGKKSDGAGGGVRNPHCTL